MRVTTRSDVQLFADGSGMWLWAVYQGSRVWRAGTATTKPVAEVLANANLMGLQATLKDRLEQPRVPDGVMETIDFDQLEKEMKEGKSS